MSSSAMPLGPRLQAVAEKLAELRRAGWQTYRANTGVSEHKFVMNPPLDPEVLHGFEEHHGVTLPEDYRTFLLQVGNGGAGPGRGLSPLEQTRPYGASRSLARPCPLQPTFEPADDWVERLGLERAGQAYEGTLRFVPFGVTVLVVSGAARGRVFHIDEISDSPPFFPHEVSFLDWYERWVDETLANLSMDGFDRRPGGTDEEHLATLASPADRQRRADAFAELKRRQKPSEAVRLALLHTDGNFRKAASRAARRLPAKKRRR